MSNETIKSLFLPLQWHVTTNCMNRCKHCYMYDDKTFHDERKNTLPLDGLIKILDHLTDFEKKYNTKFHDIAVTGGDPFLRKDIFDFFDEIHKRDIKISILGNPETLSEKVIQKLSQYKVSDIQMSLDGLEKTHNFFRSSGSFKRTVDKTKLLYEYGINCNIMLSLFPTNANDLIPLMNFVAKNTHASSFSFDVGCFVGEGKNLDNNFTPEELHKIFTAFHIEKNKLEKEYNITFHEKSNFHKITRLEKDLLPPNFPKATPTISGCLNGWQPPAILSDGTALVCRRLPIIVGKMPEDSFEDIFLKDITMKKFRRRTYFVGCKDCDLYSSCRGCPANVHSLTGDPFAENPLCFRNRIKNKPVKKTCSFNEPGLDTSIEEEWQYIRTRLSVKQNFDEYLKNKDFQYMYIELSHSEKSRLEFLKDPNIFIEKNKYKLSDNSISWLIFRFGEKIIHNHYNIKYDAIAKKACSSIVKDINAT